MTILIENNDVIKLLIADDHKVLLDGFISLFKEEDGMTIVGTARNGMEVIEKLTELKVDIVLLDINMPGMNGVEACKIISRKYPDIKVITLSMYREASYVKRMKANGARGYLLKDDSADEMISAIKEVYSGKEYYSNQLKDILINNVLNNNLSDVVSLTRREKEVIALIAEGHSNKTIAEKLFLSIHTVDSHRKNLLAKFDAKNKAELVKKAMDKGLL